LLNKLLADLPALRRLSMAHISLILVGLMWVLPFLYYYHAYPLTTFYQEWGAAVLGLCASTFLLVKTYWKNPEVPRIVLLPISLMLLALLQFVLGMTEYFSQTLLFTMYMLWATLLMMLGKALRVTLGLPLLTTVLAVFLLLGAELNALLGILQHFRWHTFLDSVVTAKNGIAVYGNMAQPNHFANYITLGLVSLGLLRLHMRSWQAVLLALPLLFVLVLSGSRSSWLYLLALSVLAALWQHRDKSCKHLLNYTVLLLLGFGLMHWVVQLPLFTGSTGSVTTIQRMLAGDTGGSIRLYLWHESWLIFTQFPLLGAGLGQFAWQHFQLAPLLHATNVTGLYNNAHNLFIQLAVEMGLSGLVVVLVTLGIWLRHSIRVQMTLYHWWGYAALSVLFIHSMLEYPLWYAYFMGVTAISLGMLDNGGYNLELRRMGRLSVASILVLGLVSLVQWQQGYRQLERVLTTRQKYADDTTVAQRMRDGLLQLRGVVLLQPYTELFLNNWMEINAVDLDKKIAFNQSAIKFIPVSNVVYRRAWLLALANKPEEAQLQMERAIWAYPGDFKTQQKELTALAQKNPEHFAALLEFAIKKNEEYLNAVSAK
jgi:O-antigen ligase